MERPSSTIPKLPSPSSIASSRAATSGQWITASRLPSWPPSWIYQPSAFKPSKYDVPKRNSTFRNFSNRFVQSLSKLQYDCQNAPWSVKGVAQSWWEDRKGVPRYFCPAGATNDDSGHNSSFRNSSPAPAAVCQCNCDSSATTRTADTCNKQTNKTVTDVDALFMFLRHGTT